MNITLMTNKSDNNVVDKNTTTLHTTTANFKESSDIVNPILVLGDIDSYISTCNYIYIEELNRYYYVMNIVSVANGLWELECHVDVLMSYKTTIRQQKCIVARQEYNYNLYLSDPRLKVNANPYVQQKYFPNGFIQNWTYAFAIMGN